MKSNCCSSSNKCCGGDCVGGCDSKHKHEGYDSEDVKRSSTKSSSCRSKEPSKTCCSSSKQDSCCSNDQKEVESSCCKEKSCCDLSSAKVNESVQKSDNDKGNAATTTYCYGIISDDGKTLAIYDGNGTLQHYTFGGNIQDLCFSTHGVANVDDLLTPCFDEDGYHGIPDEDCFCGVDTPHIHAHLKNSRICNSLTESNKDGGSDEMSSLARLTLHPSITIDTSKDIAVISDADTQKDTIKKCNSLEYTPVKQRTGIPIVRVNHGGHEDYLVHNYETEELRLEHDCQECNDRDYHGSFTLIQSRQWKGEKQLRFNLYDQKKRSMNILFKNGLFDTESSKIDCLKTGCSASGTCTSGACTNNTCATSTCCASDTCCDHSIKTKKTNTCCKSEANPVENKDETEDTSTCCSDESACTKPCCATGFCTKVRLGGSVIHRSGTRIVRSTYVCSAICCASEIPAINSILTNLKGISKTMVNVPLKNVVVDHDCQTISATEIEKVLNDNSFGAKIVRNGGLSMLAQSTTGRSRFFVDKICCASEIPAVRSIVEPLDSVTGIMINVTSKTVYVDHNAAITGAQAICNALNLEGFGASIEFDYSTQGIALLSFVVSRFRLSPSDHFKIEKITSLMETFSKDQIERFDLDISSKTLTVYHNPLLISAKELAEQMLEKIDMATTIEVDGNQEKSWDFPEAEEEEEVKGVQESCRMRPTVVLSGIFWIISMLSFIGGNWAYLKYVGLVSVAFGLPPIANKASRTLRRCQFDANCLMLFAVLGAVALQEFTEAAAVTFLFSLSEWLEVRATSRAREALTAIVNLRPDRAHLIHPRTKEIIVVPATVVPVGATVSVRSGEKIPCDGVVLEGSTTVDESSLTGESRPIRKSLGDEVQGGTINSGNSHILVQTTRTSEDSAVSRLIKLVEEAQANRSETEKLVDAFARVYTPVIVLAALCMCTIPWAWGREIGREWTEMGLVLVVIACPCALIISTPVCYVAGLAATAHKGVLIKGGAHLEALGAVKQIYFDKTGTLTQGKFKLLHLDIIGNAYSRGQIFEYLSLMEERASHPLAQALVDGAKAEGVHVPDSLFVEDHTILPGEGITGSINNLRIYVGNERLFRRLGFLDLLPNDVKEKVADWELMGGTAGFMCIGDAGIVCVYCVADAPRQESKSVLHELAGMGIDVAMLTGDRCYTAQTIGRSIGLSDEQIKCELLPAEKLEIVTAAKQESCCTTISPLQKLLSRQKLVLMCGDGINDAPSLAAANVGVAMGAGAALAMETADVTLMDSNLTKLSYSINMGRRVINKIRQNVIFSLVVKFTVLGFALAERANLWAAIASDVGAMILVTLNGMSLLPLKRTQQAIRALSGGEKSSMGAEV